MPELKEVLALVNKTRQALGVRPLAVLPKGFRNCQTECPLKRAFGPLVRGIWFRGTIHFENPEHARVAAGVWGVPWQEGSLVIQTPQLLTRFVRAIDEGHWPKLGVPIEKIVVRKRCLVFLEKKAD